MKNLLSENLRTALCRILFGDDLPEHLALVVPLQGNFLNPQQVLDKKCSAYFTYYISNTEKKLRNNQDGNVHTACVVRDLQLSCIGRDAELMMLNTLFWEERNDVQEIFREYGTILMDTPRNILARPYYQEGYNTILEYSTTMRLSSSVQLITKAERWEGDLELRGNLIIEA